MLVILLHVILDSLTKFDRRSHLGRLEGLLRNSYNNTQKPAISSSLYVSRNLKHILLDEEGIHTLTKIVLKGLREILGKKPEQSIRTI